MRIASCVLLVSAALAAPAVVHAQDDRESIIAAVRQTFDAMRARDTAAFRAVMHPTARIVITGTAPDGTIRVSPVGIDAFVQNISRSTGTPDEQFYEPEIRIDGNLATVWTRYEFFVNGSFSHCGFDSFHLAKLNGAWKILQVADTQRRDAARCGRGPGSTPITAPAPGPADTAAVIATLQKLFDAMAARDSTGLITVLHAAARTAVLSGDRFRPGTHEEFVRTVTQLTRSPKERFVSPEIRIHDNLATIWTWYDLHMGEEFSHCGYDAAQLVRTSEGWKVLHISYTTHMSPQVCRAARDG